MSQNLPRVVLITRRTPLEALLDRFGTRGQAEFYLRSRGQNLAWAQQVHDRLYEALATVLTLVPSWQRRVRIDRTDLDRFLFAPNDVVVIVGQDGLVPNVAKYLRGQLVIGLNPDPDQFDGILCAHPPAEFARLLALANQGQPSQTDLQIRVESRSMAIVRREDGQELRSLNEIFVGHLSHQSARYRIVAGGQTERQSSSGVIASTGTGATGWARSVSEQRQLTAPLPNPEEARLAWFVREPFPSISTGTSINFGYVDPDSPLRLESEMDEGGVIFADGIEGDRLEFLTGQRCEIELAPERLRLLL